MIHEGEGHFNNRNSGPILKKEKKRKEEKNERSIDFEGLKRVLPMPRGSRYKKCTPIPRSAYFFYPPLRILLPRRLLSLKRFKKDSPPSPRHPRFKCKCDFKNNANFFVNFPSLHPAIAEDTRMPGRSNLSCRFEIRNLPRMNLSLFLGCALNIIFSFLSFFPSYRNVI